jgi:mercuric ion transport protein
MRVELIYDADCPHVAATREHLVEALANVGKFLDWKEWDRAAPESPPYALRHGSPTILVDGRDVDGLSASDGSTSCRVYTDSAGEVSGVLPVEMIASALRSESGRRSGWRGLFSVFPGVGASFLLGVCPACWPAYAGVLSALGLGFLRETRYSLPISVVFLGAAFFSLGYRARSRRGYGPLVLGALGVAVALGGKILLLSTATTYAGFGVLVAASVWNSWPLTATKPGSCPACVRGGELTRVQDARIGDLP